MICFFFQEIPGFGSQSTTWGIFRGIYFFAGGYSLSPRYCVHFDDDDLYAGVYVERMVNEMRQRNLVALTLSAWHNFFESRDRCGYSTPGC